MKQHTNNFKNAIKKMGREFDNIITLIDDDTTLTEELFSVSYSYDGNILKSVMKSLEIESSVLIPKQTKLNYKLGLFVEGEYEYIDYGNFIVYDYELQEDTGNYKITCYDNLLNAMSNYIGTNTPFPMTVRDFINDLCSNLNITFANKDNTFVNYNREIESDLYADLGYTYRDIFDELAQVTASTICINENNELEIRYINNTLDTIDEEFLKDTNVAFGEKYGPINSIVLSRSAESDNVYLRDEDSISQNGLCEIKIKDNQIMNFNDRSDYLPDILQALDGLEFYINDFSSTGICYYDLCDRYSIQIGENSYSCIMLNDEININQGLEELIYTDTLEESETDYTKADKTDRRLNQTYIIVDKQNQIITSLANEVGQYNNRISRVEQTTEGLETLVRDEIDITRSVEGTDPLTMGNSMKGDLLELHIYGDNNVFSQLFPKDDLYPSDTLYPKGDSRIHIYTNNKCPDNIEDWEQCLVSGTTGQKGYNYNNSKAIITLKDYIIINSNNTYISVENNNYKILNCYGYDEENNYIENASSVFGWSNNKQEGFVSWSNNVKKILVSIALLDYAEGDEKNYPEILPSEILSIKPMLTYTTEKQEYSGYNNSLVELGVSDVLRRLIKADDTVIRDEYKLVNNKGYVIRRVGVDSNGNLYDLETEVTEELGEIIIPIAEGENYFEIVNYDAFCNIKWVIRNNYTNTFATTVELQSSITQLANSINLQVSKKVGNDEIIARINMAVLGRDEAEVPEDIEKSIIEILANKISITSDYFSITNNGVATFKQGTIGNWSLNNGYLFSDHYEGSTKYQSGLSSVSTGSGTTIFLYAGADVTSGSTSLTNSNFYITNAGLCKAKWFTVNGESGYFYINYDSGRTAMRLNKSGIYWKLDNTTNNNFCYFAINQNGIALTLDDCPAFTIYDEIHNETIATFARYRPEAGVNDGYIYLWRKTTYFAGGSTGYEIATKNDISDPSVKKNIQDVKEKALDKIKKIEFKQFDWDEDKIDKKGHINIGIIAPQVEKIDKNFVEKTIVQNNEGEKIEAKELYSLNVLNLLTTSMKAIQELSEIVEQQQKEINELKEKLKGENNG